jgi:IclR family transcriptional regulator, acetate operon repressor
MTEPMRNVVTTLSVLEAVSVRQPVGVNELARATAIPKTTVLRALASLDAAGWIAQGTDGWVLTLKPAIVGHRAGNVLGVRSVARPVMARLREEVDETIQLWVADGRRVVIVEALESSRAVRDIPVLGGRLLAHASAAGKAILADLPPAELDQALAGPLRRLTPATITDPTELRAALAEIRARGWGDSTGEAVDDVGAVAAVIRDPGGRPVGAIGASLPVHRKTPELTAHLGEVFAAAAREVSDLLVEHPADPVRVHHD